jgi:glycosyltransferase involved in cell wall biosynthesis
VPVVLDFHENYPAALRLWRRRWLDRTLFSPERAEKLEGWSVKGASRVVVVVDEARERLVANGADPERIVVFGNTESVDLVPEVAPDLPDGLKMVYVGGIAPHRGLESAVRAMPAIRQQRPDSHLTIVGDGVSLDELKDLATSLGVNDCVTFTGRLPLEDAMERVREASVGLVPHLKSPHTEATVPHKLFQYMALGRPVLVSDCAPLERIVGLTGSGGVFVAGDPESFAEQALALAAGRQTLVAAGVAGREAASGKWNLEAESAKLVGMYDGLAAE